MTNKSHKTLFERLDGSRTGHFGFNQVTIDTHKCLTLYDRGVVDSEISFDSEQELLDLFKHLKAAIGKG